MAIRLSQLESMMSAAEDLELSEIPDLWQELHAKGWTMKLLPLNCGNSPDGCIDTSGVLHGGRWGWIDEKGEYAGCVCHSDPSDPSLTTTVSTHIFDQGGWSECSHCHTDITGHRPDVCPNCRRTFVPGGKTTYSEGGSDF